MILTIETRSTIEKTHPRAALSPTKLTRVRTRVFAVKDRRIIASSMANFIASVDIKWPQKGSPMKWYQASEAHTGRIYVKSEIADFYGI